MPSIVLYLLFFCSGVSGLIYQVIWVREFGNVFGATIYTASLVIALFMLGLGAGSYLIGRWADRRYILARGSLLRAYALAEFAIAVLGLTISLALPHLHALAAATSSYVVDGAGWFTLSPGSYAAQGAIALVVLGPTTLLMGGTLTLLIRHSVGADVERNSAWKIAVLYAVNTAGAATGAFLTDFVLVPASGLQRTQLAAVALNAAAGAGALVLSRSASEPARKSRRRRTQMPGSDSSAADAGGSAGLVAWTCVALMLSGFAAMGVEILWLRHINLLLGGFRSVFSLVLTVMLAGIAVGSLAGGVVNRLSSKPAEQLMVVQAMLAAGMLLGLASNSAASLIAERHAADTAATALSPFAFRIAELWYNLRPILVEVGLPSLLMGCAFPLANAVVQHAERAVGARAGALYLMNTAGAVLGSLVAGYVLLPRLGLQGSAAVLAIVAALAIVPLTLTASRRSTSAVVVGPAVVAALATVWWLWLPSDFVLRRSLAPLPGGERMVAIHEGVTEIAAVTEVPGLGRSLMTNGHAMSSTAALDQRYMRALAHIPLLGAAHPTRVLVIGFGVGNTTDAATRHATVEQVDVADLSREILGQAGYFREANHDVLRDPRVKIFVNDGRQHLLMQPAGTYDLITLEPPPIAHAGVAALYSREFYELARTRLKPEGYLSQWLPAYQVPAETSLAMVRAFVDVFPQSVLLSGMHREFLLVGTNGPSIEVDPGRIEQALRRSPRAAEDLRRLDLGTVTELIGTFVGSKDTLARATRDTSPVSDDRPLQEYGVRSVLNRTGGVPAALVDLSAAATWCPRCFDGDRPVPPVAGLDTYLALLDEAYHAPGLLPAEELGHGPSRRILGSAYLGAILPDTDAVYNIVGVTLLREARYQEAADAFSAALKRRADSPDANRNLGTALAATGHQSEAITYLRRAVQLAPDNAGAQYELGNLLLARREFAEAAECFKATIRAQPDFAAAHNGLGIALATLGGLPQAIEEFQRAVNLEPQFGEARRNLAAAVRAGR
jgi:spermidine synthase/tetratricopeptide (TPR) repeat protein